MVIYDFHLRAFWFCNRTVIVELSAKRYGMVLTDSMARKLQTQNQQNIKFILFGQRTMHSRNWRFKVTGPTNTDIQTYSHTMEILKKSVLTLYSPYVPHSGQYMYRTVVTICTAQWSLYVQHSGHYMYSTVVTICTAQWSLYVPHSGHHMYSTVVTICTAQWSLYVPPV